MNKTGELYSELLHNHEEEEKALNQDMTAKTTQRTFDANRRNQTEKQNRMLEDELLVISETETAVLIEKLKHQAHVAANAQETNLT